MTNSLLLKMTIEIVSFPINSMVIFHSYVSLPEGIYSIIFYHPARYDEIWSAFHSLFPPVVSHWYIYIYIDIPFISHQTWLSLDISHPFKRSRGIPWNPVDQRVPPPRLMMRVDPSPRIGWCLTYHLWWWDFLMMVNILWKSWLIPWLLYG